MSFNKSILLGRLTSDPENYETASGHLVAKFTLAVDRNYGEDKQTDFFPCIAWRGTAEAIARYVKKGQQLLVSGSLQNRQWEDNKGSKHTTTELLVSDFSFCEAKKESSTTSSTEPRTGRNKPVLQAMDDDGDIPF